MLGSKLWSSSILQWHSVPKLSSKGICRVSSFARPKEARSQPSDSHPKILKSEECNWVSETTYTIRVETSIPIFSFLSSLGSCSHDFSRGLQSTRDVVGDNARPQRLFFYFSNQNHYFLVRLQQIIGYWLLIRSHLFSTLQLCIQVIFLLRCSQQLLLLRYSILAWSTHQWFQQ